MSFELQLQPPGPETMALAEKELRETEKNVQEGLAALKEYLQGEFPPFFPLLLRHLLETDSRFRAFASLDLCVKGKSTGMVRSNLRRVSRKFGFVTKRCGLTARVYTCNTW